MKTSKYWKNRFIYLEELQNKKSSSFYKELEEAYLRACNNIEKEILGFYGKYAKNNNISLNEAKKILNAGELKAFKLDVKEYIRLGEQLHLEPKWLNTLQKASVRVHISRLEAIKTHIQQQIEVLSKFELDEFDTFARDTYTSQYYNTAFEIAKGTGVATNLAMLDVAKINSILLKAWTPDGKTFSDRIWIKKNQLIDYLHKELTQNILTGKTPQHLVKDISRKFNVSVGQSARLVYTENAYFSSVSQKQSFIDVDVKRYELVATLDLSTSDTCRELDGKVFKMSDYQIGRTAPPFHPFCRTVTAPYFEDNITERYMRSKEGKSMVVKEDIKYNDWFNKYVLKK